MHRRWMTRQHFPDSQLRNGTESTIRVADCRMTVANPLPEQAFSKGASPKDTINLF
jgi:hypothetical protein